MAERIDTESLFVQTNGIRMHVQRVGEGTPLIMIMGLGSPGEKWRHNFEFLSSHFQCIIPDNRGAGETEKPEADAYSTEQMSDDIFGMMEALHIEKAHVIGVSMGGAIAQMLALKHPERVISLVLTSTFAAPTPSFRQALEILSGLKESVKPEDLKALNMWMTTGQFTQGHHSERIEALVREDAGYPYPMPLYAYRAQCQACLNHNTVDRLHEIKMPVLIASGAKDLFMNEEATRQLRDGIPQAEFYLCPDGGHIHQWEYADVYDSVVLGFLLKQDAQFNSTIMP